MAVLQRVRRGDRLRNFGGPAGKETKLGALAKGGARYLSRLPAENSKFCRSIRDNGAPWCGQPEQATADPTASGAGCSENLGQNCSPTGAGSKTHISDTGSRCVSRRRPTIMKRKVTGTGLGPLPGNPMEGKDLTTSLPNKGFEARNWRQKTLEEIRADSSKRALASFDWTENGACAAPPPPPKKRFS